VNGLEEYFEKTAFPTLGCKGTFWSAMAEMTPDEAYQIEHPQRGLRGMAQMVNIPLTYWWHRPEWYSRSMIISTDFFLGNNIIEMSVQVNKNKLVCPPPTDNGGGGTFTLVNAILVLLSLLIASTL